MKQVGRKNRFSRLYASAVCFLIAIAMLCGGIAVLLGGLSVGAKADGRTDAVYLGMDKMTRGNWYDPASAPGGEKANASNSKRLYGKDGAVIVYEKITGDGQPVKDVSRISDFTEESTVNYAEYPSYVDSIECTIESTNDTPHGYWNYNEEKSHGAVTAGALLSPDPERWNRKDVGQSTHDYIYLTVNVNDDVYHKISVYVEDCSGDRASWYHYLRIMDLDKNVLSSVVCNDYKNGIYYSFAVKGSFIMNVQKMPGTIYGIYNGMFFDPMMSEEEDAAKQKEDFSAVLEGARTVQLSWKNKTPSATAIYRKIKDAPNSAYEQIAYIANPNATAYTDTTAQVAKSYTYMIGGGVANDEYRNITDYLLPKLTTDVDTAAYDLTSVTFDERFYLSESVKKEISVSVVVHKDVKYDDNGQITDAGVPYADTTVTFALDGKLVYDKSQVDIAENMNPIVGKAVTDKNGKASLTFIPEYAGTFEIVASVAIWSDPQDETVGYDGSEGRATLDIELAEWTEPPVLFSISDAIRPGETFTVMGTEIRPTDGFKVAMAPNAGICDPEFDGGRDGIIYLEPLFTDSLYSSGVMLVMPETLKAGLYDVWVYNEYGWSNGLTLNGARALFLSQEAAYEGLEIEVVGRNFFPDEFGMEESLRKELSVKLINRGNGAETVVKPSMGIRYTEKQSVTGKAIEETNPYRLTFVVPSGLAVGEYDVYVANDGRNYRATDSGQTLKIVQKKTGDANARIFGSESGYDPLNLGVYWAQELNYQNVEQMSAKDGMDEIDDTQTIQQKINSLSANGGGILYFNAGTFYASRIDMKNNVMLVGAGNDQTNLKVRQDNSTYGYFISNGGSNNGIARIKISLDLEKGKSIPDMYLNFSDQPDSSSDVDLRKHCNVFVKDVVMDFPYDVQDPYKTSGNNRGLGILLSGKKNFVIDDNEITGYFAVLHRGFVNEYVSIRNNIFKVQRDVMHCMASYAFIENTALLGNNNDGHGWSARSDCYFGNNFISRVGLQYPRANNNGEVIMLEVPGAQINYGSVMGVNTEENTITLARDKGLPMTTCDYNYFAVVITDGRGMGQIRYIERKPVSGMDDSKLNYGNTFRLRAGQKPWDVTPDQTSSYAVYVPIEHATIYRNKAEDCAKSILLYSQCHDAIVAENELKNTDGISVYSTVGTTGTKGTNIFVRVERNRVEGVSVMTRKGAIGVMTERWTEGQSYAGMLAGGVSIRYNTVLNTPKGEYIPMSETPALNGIYVHTKGAKNVVETVGDIRFTIVEGNKVENSEYGVYIDNRAYCTAITGNEFKNIEVEEYVTNIGASDLSISARLKFEADGGTISGGGDGMYMMNDELPTAEKEGYAFWGWSETSAPVAGDQPIIYAPSSNMTLYAVFGYSLTLKYNYEGNDGVYRTVVVLPDTAAGVLPTPYRTDAKFAGWYTDAACKNEFDPNKAVEGNQTLYAKWTDGNNGEEVDDSGKNSGCGSALSFGAGMSLTAVLTVAVGLIRGRKRKP